MDHVFPANLTNDSTGDRNSTILANIPARQYMLITLGITSVGCVILVLNVFVFVCLAKHCGQLGTEAMKVQLMSITLSDILTSISIMSNCLANTQLFSCNRYACAVLVMFFYVVQTASVLTMALIGAQRLVQVLNIKKKQSDLTNRGTKVVQVTVPVIWAISLLLYVGLYALYAERDTLIPTCQCKPNEVFGENHKLFNNSVLYINIGSLLVVNGIYFTIFIKLRSLYPSPVKRKRPCCMPFLNTDSSNDDNVVDADLPKKCTIQTTRDEMRTGDPGCKHEIMTSSVSATGQLSSSDQSHVENYASSGRSDKSKPTTFNTIARKSHKNNVQALVTVSLVLIAINISTAPFVILRVLRNLASVEVSVVTAAAVNACISLNALLDPFVYCWRIKQVRQSLKRVLASLFCPKVCCRR